MLAGLGNRISKLSKSKVIVLVWLAITFIVLLCLQMKPSSTAAFISIQEVSTDDKNDDNSINANSRSCISSSSNNRLLTTDNIHSVRRNVSLRVGGGLKRAGQAIKKMLVEGDGNYVDDTKTRTVAEKMCININSSGKHDQVTTIRREGDSYDDKRRGDGLLKDLTDPPPGYKDSILLSSSQSLLGYSIPKYLPGYLNPCFHLEMGEVHRLMQETWKQNTAVSSDQLGVYSTEGVLTEDPTDPELVRFEDRSNKEKLKYSSSSRTQQGKVGLCLPGFFLVGIRKSGTSDLAFKLMKHQQIYSGSKEGHFFDSLTTPQCGKFVFRKWSYNLLQYLALLKWGSVGHAQTLEVKNYNGSINMAMMSSSGSSSSSSSDTTSPYGKYTLLGDYTPAYSTKVREICRDKSTRKFDTPAKIQHLVPNAKIIFILRDPVSRASSDIRYAMKKNLNFQTDLLENIHAAFLRAIRWWRKCTSQYGERSYECIFSNCWNRSEFVEHYIRALRNGVYYAYVQEYLRVFDSSQVLIVDTGEYTAEPFQYIEDHVLPFLGLPPYAKDLKAKLTESIVESNQNKKVTFQLLRKTEVLLQRFYRPYNRKLSELLSGRTFSWYRTDD